MLKSKTFVKKTRSGGIMKIVREHYLRDDIWCGSEVCTECKQEETVLQKDTYIESNLCSFPHYLLPDTNIVLSQLRVSQTRSCPRPPVARSVFLETYIEREQGESANDRNDRAIRISTKWLKVVLLTNDRGNKEKAEEFGLLTYRCKKQHTSVTSVPQDETAVLNEITSSKVLFPEHLPLSRIQSGIKSGTFQQGTFRASRDNYLEATVFVHGEGDDSTEVLIQGLQNLNRAVHQDLVAVEILPLNQWVAPSSVVLQDEGPKEDDVTEEEEEAELKSGPSGAASRKPTGRVVGIIKRNWRPFCGMLFLSQIKEATRHLFTPADRRIPRIRIETRQAATLAGQRIMVAVDGWPKHSRYPNGHFVRSLGSAGDKETETEVLLLEHDVPHQDFSQAVLSFLPKMPWNITEEDMAVREDLRNLTVCSVDPPGCTDIDDALHCRDLPNGNQEVGVHIADVSHFIRPGNAMDLEAANRGTTVYLTGRRIDMVPELLSSNLCSLRSSVERLAFSCIWEINDKAEIVKTRFTKSVINSKASLTYAEAQMRIDDANMNDDTTKSLRGLNRLAKILKKRRIEKGALTLSSPEVRFHIDSETHDPIDLQTKELKETNSMVEEFMLLANISVAQKIYDEFSECALLRKHPAPPPSNYDILNKAAKSKDMVIHTDSAKALADSLDAAQVDGFPYFNTLLRILATRCMMQAVYFCSGMDSDFHHYGLASPIYTHFTSPIRRYSDIIVHRLLAVAIGADSTYPDLMDKHKQSALCNNLNYRHKMAQYAQRASVAYHTQLFFKSRGILNEEGFILFVRKNAIIVLIPKFGLEGTVFFENKDKPSPKLIFNEEVPSLTVEGHSFNMFDKVKVTISLDASNVQHQKIRMSLVEPVVLSVAPSEPEPEVKRAKLDR
uniref:Exosome complex exonuclease RRP44 n=1 Tax=Oncorhynchus kisutch TaxID=8019 RepID=A0A8C7N682_ONCKI